MKKINVVVSMLVIMLVLPASIQAQRISFGAGVFGFSADEFDLGVSMNLNSELFKLADNLWFTIETDDLKAKYEGMEHFKSLSFGLGVRSESGKNVDFGITGGVTFNELPDFYENQNNLEKLWVYENSTGFFVNASSSLYLPIYKETLSLFLRGITGYRHFKSDASWAIIDGGSGDYIAGSVENKFNLFHYAVIAGLRVAF